MRRTVEFEATRSCGRRWSFDAHRTRRGRRVIAACRARRAFLWMLASYGLEWIPRARALTLYARERQLGFDPIHR